MHVIGGHCEEVLWDSEAGLRWILRFYSPQRKIFHGRGSAAPRPGQGGPARGDSGGIFQLRTKGSSCDAGRRESRHQERDFGFVPIRGGGRLAGLYTEPTTAGAAASGGQRALLIRIVQ